MVVLFWWMMLFIPVLNILLFTQCHYYYTYLIPYLRISCPVVSYSRCHWMWMVAMPSYRWMLCRRVSLDLTSNSRNGPYCCNCFDFDSPFVSNMLTVDCNCCHIDCIATYATCMHHDLAHTTVQHYAMVWLVVTVSSLLMNLNPMASNCHPDRGEHWYLNILTDWVCTYSSPLWSYREWMPISWHRIVRASFDSRPVLFWRWHWSVDWPMRLVSLVKLAMHCDQCPTTCSYLLNYYCCYCYCYADDWHSLLPNFVVYASVNWTILLHHLPTFRCHSICYYYCYYLYCYCQTMLTHYCYLNDGPMMMKTTMFPMPMNDSMILNYSHSTIAGASIVGELWLVDSWTKPVWIPNTMREHERKREEEKERKKKEEKIWLIFVFICLMMMMMMSMCFCSVSTVYLYGFTIVILSR